MATNLHAMIRYNVINRCMRDRNRVYHWKDLSESCAEEFHQIYDIKRAPSKRTIGLDIQNMRSGKLGYTAPIEYNKENGYYYSNTRFSIHHISLSKDKLQDLRDAIQLLRQLTKNEKLMNINSSLALLEQSMNIEIDHQVTPIIYFEESLNEQGQKWLDVIYSIIKKKVPINIRYAPFEDVERIITLSPAIIKAFNNRWYTIGWDHTNQRISNLALDRIEDISPSLQTYIIPEAFDPEEFYAHIYGITVYTPKLPEKIVFKTRSLLSKYLITKPLHTSQQLLDKEGEWTTFSLYLAINYEIKHKLLSFGADAIVLEPLSLRHEIVEKFQDGIANYG